MAKCPSVLMLARIAKDNIIYVLILISCDSVDAILKKGLRATGWGEGKLALYASLIYSLLFSCMVMVYQIFLLMFLFLIIFEAILDSNV